MRGNNKISAQWDPIQIAIKLMDKKVLEEDLNKVFKKPELKEWASNWKSATYSD